MRKPIVFLLACLAPNVAQAAPSLSDIDFLIGHWTSGEGKVADTGGISKGSSTITFEAGGKALLRRDHTDLFDAKGAHTGGFDQVMIVYADGGAIHADYVDGEGHAIHYTSATVTPGKEVTFSSAPGAGPVFQLSYEMKTADTLAVTFGMTPPGQTAFRPIATGTLKKSAD